MFTDESRYKKATQYQAKDHRGRTVNVAATPDAPNQPLQGYHLRKQGQHTDHLAARYLNEPTAFWRIAEANDAMLAESLTEKQEIAIPNKR
ncbi:MAG: hypothetical protein WCO44_05810 [Bacteroidota bacterium]